MSRPSSFFLTSTRLGFRRWTNEDIGLALDLWGDPRVTRWIDARGQLSESEVRNRLEHEIVTQREHGMQYWPIFLRESSEHVGCCGLRPYDGAAGVVELGFQILSQHWGNGYATEAARAVIQHAFDALETQALFAGHHPDNAASPRVLFKLGFHHTHQEFYEPTNAMHPSYILPRISLRDVREDDLSIFFEHQRDPEAAQMAAFPAREREAFMAHWGKIMASDDVITRTVLFTGRVAGNIGSFDQGDKRQVGYWIGREYWGKGVATGALAAFLHHETTRPLYAHVAWRNAGSIRVLEKCGFTRPEAAAETVGSDGVEELLMWLPGKESPR